MHRPFTSLSASFRTVLLCLLATDAVLIGVNVVAEILQGAHFLAEVPDAVRITRDWSLPEDFNYLKWAVIVVALGWIALRDRWLPAIPWALIFLMILLDDTMHLHESVGQMIASNLDLHPSLYLLGSDFGEILAFLAMGLAALIVTIMLLTRFGDTARIMTIRYFAVVIALAFFGVGVDALHQIVFHVTEGQPAGPLMSKFVGMVEDGGEMFVASLAVALTLAPPVRTVVDGVLARPVRS